MTQNSAKIRLFIEEEISLALDISLTFNQAKYLFLVMRLKVGDSLNVFDGKTGEYVAIVKAIGKKTGQISIRSKIKDVCKPPDLWLLFSPLKKARTDFIVEKATELGVTRLVPVITSRTRTKSFRLKRFEAIVIEALEQCGGTFVPEISEPVKLIDCLQTWPNNRDLIFCDEALVESPLDDTWSAIGKANYCGILIGPEGGFSPEESSLIKSKKFCRQVSLGCRILRADTAVVSALALWYHHHLKW